MPSANCGGCGRFIAAADDAKCGKCSAHYHRACVGLQARGNVPSTWRCPDCKKNLARDNKCDTPVRVADNINIIGNSTSGSSAGSTAPSDFTEAQQLDSASMQGVEHGSQQCTGSDLMLIMGELKAVREELRDFRLQMQAEMTELKASMGICNTRLDSLEARVEGLEKRAAADPGDAKSMDGIVEELRRELNDRDQDLLGNDIEISNLPESKAENPIHLVRTISQLLGVSVDDRDVVSAERVGGRQINVTSPGGPVVQRPRAIIVRLARRDLRDELLQSARVRRGATTADLNMPGPVNRFYLNERLTKTNRQLFRKTRDAAALHGWKYVWTKRGRILVRNKPGDSTRRIRSETDISDIIVPVSTGN